MTNSNQEVQSLNNELKAFNEARAKIIKENSVANDFPVTSKKYSYRKSISIRSL